MTVGIAGTVGGDAERAGTEHLRRRDRRDTRCPRRRCRPRSATGCLAGCGGAPRACPERRFGAGVGAIRRQHRRWARRVSQRGGTHSSQSPPSFSSSSPSSTASSSSSKSSSSSLVFVVFVVVVVVGGFEFNGGRAGHFEVGAAVGAADQIALVDVELIDFDICVTFRTGGHTCSWRERLARSSPALSRVPRLRKSSDYSENLINSATQLTPAIACRRYPRRDGAWSLNRAHHQDRHRRRRHRLRAGSLRHSAPQRRTHGVHREERRGAARPRPRGPCAHRSDRTRSCGCRMPGASSWCGRSGRSIRAGSRSWCSAAPSPRADEVRDLAALGVAGYVNEYSAVQHILPSLAPHLFPDNFNRRGSPRVVLGIPVAYRFGNTIAAALTLNLSKGGVAIRTMSPLQGRKLRVRFRLPGSKRDIEAEVPRRVERSPGRHGPAVREGGVGRSGGDRRVRRPALLLESKGLSYQRQPLFKAIEKEGRRSGELSCNLSSS